MQRHLLMFTALCLLAVISTALLRPDPAIQFEVELSTLEPEEALARLETADPEMKSRENIALLHATLALNAGRTGATRIALKNLESAEDLTALMQEQLSEVAILEEDLPAAIDHLRAAHDAEPTTARRLKLGIWYRLSRETGAELMLLQSVAPSALSDGEAERLAQLLLQARRFDELESAYTLLAEKADRTSDTFRRRLLDLQIESGRPQDAVATALRWFAQSDRSQEPMELAVAALVARGSIDEAYHVAEVSMAAAHDTSHVLIPLFARSGHRALAIELQTRWLETSDGISDEAWATLIGFTDITGDPRGLRIALSRVPADEIAPDILDRVLLEILRYQGVRALVPFGSLLTQEFLDEAPLIGAAWMMSQGRERETLSYLVASAGRDNSDWEAQIWLHIAGQLAGTPAHRQLLQATMGDPRLDDVLRGAAISAAQPIRDQ